jgi:uncharacterized membrane protein YbhN (UPF0104 family)
MNAHAAAADAGGSRALRWTQRAIFALALVFIVLYLTRSWSRVGAYSWRVRRLPLLLSVVAFFAFYILNGLAWWLLLRGFGLRSSPTRAIATWSKSILARYVPGNVFMFLGRGIMSYRQGLDIDRVGAAMVYEQALGLCSALVAAALLLPFWHYHRAATAWSLLLVPVMVVLMHPKVFARLAGWALRVLRRQPLTARLSFGTVLALLCYYVATWLLAGVASWLFATAVTGLGADMLATVAAGYVLAYIAGMVVFFLPSGLGLREALLAAPLAARLPGGVAFAWALLLRVWQTLIELAFVGAAVLLEASVHRGERHGGD